MFLPLLAAQICLGFHTLKAFSAAPYTHWFILLRVTCVTDILSLLWSSQEYIDST